MKRLLATLPLVFVLGMGFNAAVGDEPQAHPAFVSLNDEEFALCGLDKLTGEELDFLAGFLVAPPVVDYSDAATQYLLEEGWRIIALHGAFDPGDDDPFHDLLQVAYVGDTAYLVRPVFESDTLLPGFYLCERTTGFEIVAPDGKGVSYAIETEL